MKKSLVALAVLAAAGVASAQSSVTLFGIVDASVSHYSVKDGQSQTVLGNSGYNSSRLGFRGTEDLGGGLAAGFWLEAPLANDDGNASSATSVSVVNPNGTVSTQTTTRGGFTFQRRATVSLSGGFGEVRLGRDYTPTFWNDTVFDPFGTNGTGTNLISGVHNAGGLVGIIPGLTAAQSAAAFTDGSYVRASNTIGYFLPPNLGGFYGQVQLGLDEQVHNDVGFNSKAGRYVGGRFGYANGPLDVALAYGQSKTFNSVTTSIDVSTLNLGASYDFGVVKLFGELSQVKNDIQLAGFADTEAKANGFLIGATAPIGAGLIRASYSIVKLDADGVSADPKAQKFALGYVHNLSKRTALYATLAHVSNKNGAAFTAYGGGNAVTGIAGTANKSSNGYDFGIRHSF